MKRFYILFVLFFYLSPQLFVGQTAINLENSNDFEFKLLQNSKEGFKAEQNAGDFEIALKETKEGVFSEIRTEHLMKTYRKGHPNLPVVSKLIEIPVGADYKVKVISYDVEEISLTSRGIENKLMPAQPSQSKCDEGKDERFYFSEKLYKTDKFIGDQLVKVEDRGLMRDVRYGRLQISPLRYNPVQNKLKVYSNIKFEVKFSGIDEAKAEKLKKKYASPHFEQFHRRAINYQGSRSKELIDNSPITYVIVSDRMFEDQLQPFIEWKELKGYNVEVGYTDNIGSTTSEIKSYLEDLYNNPNPTAPSFVLFVGDVGQIPAWDGDAGSHVTDLDYCEYTGDNLPEVYYGRFSAQNTTQLQPQIDKTLEYEKYEMSDPSYLSEALLVAGNDDSYEDPYGNGAMWYGDNYYFNSDNGINSHLFLQDPPNGNAAVSDSIVENMNAGITYANYTAHCNSSGWGTPSFTISDVNNLTNEGKYGLWVGNCCLSVKFDDDECFGEAALRAANKGAIGDIGGSNSTYWDEDYWWAVGNHDNINSEPSYEATGTGAYDAMFHTKSNEANDPSTWYITQGQAVVGGNMAVEASTSTRKEYYWEIYHLMGDPSLTPYLGVPDVMTVNTTPSTLMIGMNSLTVNTEPHAYVALSFNDGLLDAKRADETGEVTLNFESLSNVGEADLVITAQNKQPHIGTITVSPSDQPYVTLDSLSLDDATGNNNGEADYGEDLNLDVVLANVSDSYEAFNVSDTLLSDDPYVTISDDLQTYGDIAPEADSLIEGAFAFTVSDSVPDQHTVNFAMHIGGEDSEANEYMWQSDFSVKLNAPQLEIGELTIVDTTSGNGDGILDPGETADLTVEVSNTGHSDISGVEGSLNTNASELTINTGSDGPYSIAAGATETLIFNVTADGATPIGTPVSVGIDAAGSANNYTDTTAKQIVIGEIPEYLISDEGTVSTCVGLFYDSGGPDGEYSNDESYTMTFEPATSGNVIQAEFLNFDVEEDTYSGGCYDELYIYDGPDTGSDLIGVYCNEAPPETITATNAEGALTFEFVSDGFVTKAGWEAEISCVNMNEVVFSVTDGSDPIENAEVTFASSTLQTDASGEASFVVEAGTYDYTVSKTGYDNATGTLDVSTDMTENVTLNISTYDITFNLYEEDGTTSIDGDVTFDGSTVTTTGGSYTFTGVEYSTDKPFSVDVGGDYYMVYEDTIDATSDKSIDVVMQPILYDVAVRVEDQGGSGVENATVAFSSIEDSAITNSDGIANFQLSQGNYSYDATHEAYEPGSGSVEVTGNEASYSDTVALNILTYDITFTLYEEDGTTSIDGDITFDGTTVTTSGGSYTFADVEYGTNKSFTVEAEGSYYDTYEGTVDVTSDKSVEVVLEPNLYDVAVRVEDGEGTGVEGAAVEITGGKASATTGPDGTVNFQLSQGSYSYNVTHEFYTDASGSIEVTGDDASYSDTAVVSLETYTVEVNVQDDLGEAVDAEVTFGGTTKTAEGGSCVFEAVEYSGDISYEANAEECYPASGSVHLMSDTTLNLELTRKSYDIVVHVSNTEGEALPAVSVDVGDRSAQTDESGDAHFSGLYKGMYDCHAEKDGYADDNQQMMVEKDSTYSLSLTRVYELTFVITDQGDDPVSGAEVSIDTSTLVTGESGQAAVSLPVGEYSYTITAEGYEDKEGTVDLSSGKKIYATLSEAESFYELAFDVTDESGEPVAGAEISVDGKSLATDSTGEAAVTLSSGEYNYTITADGYEKEEGSVKLDTARVVNATLTAVEQVYDLSFEVTDQGGDPVSGAEISVDTASLVTGESGKASVSLSSGEYSYSVTADGYEEEEGQIELDGAETVSVSLTATETGIESSLSEGLNIYPNPADERLVIENPTERIIEYELVDISGKTVQNGTLPLPVNTIDISLYPDGMYFIRFKEGENVVSHQLIIE